MVTFEEALKWMEQGNVAECGGDTWSILSNNFRIKTYNVGDNECKWNPAGMPLQNMRQSWTLFPADFNSEQQEAIKYIIRKIMPLSSDEVKEIIMEELEAVGIDSID
jgi:hypothetical protein